MMVATISSLADMGASNMDLPTYTESLVSDWGGESKVAQFGVLVVLDRADGIAHVRYGQRIKGDFADKSQRLAAKKIVTSFQDQESPDEVVTGIERLSAFVSANPKRVPFVGGVTGEEGFPPHIDLEAYEQSARIEDSGYNPFAPFLGVVGFALTGIIATKIVFLRAKS